MLTTRLQNEQPIEVREKKQPKEACKMNIEENQAEMNERLAHRAKEILTISGNCAQTSFAVLQEEFNLDGGEVLRALTPFPGIALRGETCGAVVGSLMALGLVYGRDDLCVPPGNSAGDLKRSTGAPRAAKSLRPSLAEVSISPTVFKLSSTCLQEGLKHVVTSSLRRLR
jgi:hypothetical protein